MASRAAYDDDFYVWSQEQAALLRALPRGSRDLSNALDIENIAEEIESVGRSELNRVTSLIERVLVHLLKIVSLTDDADPIRHWRSEVRHWLRDLERHYLPSMRQSIDFGKLWSNSVKLTADDLADFDNTLLSVPAICPINLGDLLSETTGIDQLIARIRVSGAGID